MTTLSIIQIWAYFTKKKHANIVSSASRMYMWANISFVCRYFRFSYFTNRFLLPNANVGYMKDGKRCGVNGQAKESSNR
ncbi:hypothetical protein AFCA_008287 [Aspergillus flavus]|nr:hypothetical protein AFCA_008287 [Aspergillus flavus]